MRSHRRLGLSGVARSPLAASTFWLNCCVPDGAETHEHLVRVGEINPDRSATYATPSTSKNLFTPRTSTRFT